ncbi:hypothetical protein PR202_ga29995 [Eleusine coracana subsp. coracana]|uniref:Protein kinase domain-containing protein n=1 Tax=Eleusine coracana subsp. coracana TaxID=191504 RepID=A0AAV5DL47_ELECO|nr:hypothetical protein PR202_ga29995 [Eleusine coracana subsp. coracana]
MWRLKQLMPKEQTAGLEGRNIDVANVKVHVREVIAEGGFSCVYAARDMVNPTKQYALKHMIIQDEETLELAQKEITVMRSLKGHPNVVTLVAHAILDMGRTREALLVMEFCEKSLVSMLEGRGAAYFDEEKVALIFRDVCNAVFAMHCQTLPVAHRDLKAENVLLGSDGAWKLCDFGSVSTNHKRFDKPEEMGVEEDNIRKHTTPAYRAPEMWDLYRREVLCEKVDIWVWFRVNELLQLELQKDLPDGSPSGSAFESLTAVDEAPRTMPQRSSPSLSRDNMRTNFDSSNQRSQCLSNATETKGSMGAFWSTQHAQELGFVDDKWSAFDKEQATSNQAQDQNQNTPAHTKSQRSFSASIDSSPGDYEIRFSPNGSEYGLEKTKTVKAENKTAPQTTAFNSFVAHFDDINLNKQNNVSSFNATSKLKEQQLEEQVILLKEQLKITNLEKEEISLKFDRLSAICSSQRREIQELKKALATASATSSVELKEHSKVELSPPSANLDTPPREKIEGTPPELRQGLFTSSPGTPSPDSKSCSNFPEPEEPKPQVAKKSAHPMSVRTLRASNSTKASSLGQSKTRIASDPFAFGQDSFKADPSGTVLPKISNLGNTSQPFDNLNTDEGKKDDPYQPAGWTGF